jgi:hypothetical protein
MRYLRQSQHHMDESFIEIYGNYAMKLLKMQNDFCKCLIDTGGLTTKRSRPITFIFIPAARASLAS